MSKRSIRRSRHLQPLPDAVDTQPRYERAGLLAIDPQAFLMFFTPPAPEVVNETVDDVEIVDVCGPLDQHASRWCDSYEAIRGRVQAACDGPARTIVLRVDSPGGEAGGCFEAARALRAMCAAAGKPLHAFVEGKACSAAYALSSAAETITLSDTALVGSIGVINTRADYSRMNAERGVQYAIIASGARKADGHPDHPISEAELAETKLLVDSLASVFFALVAETRGTTPEAVAQMQGRTYHAQAAVAAGLADFVQPFDQMLARLAGTTGDSVMPTPYEKAKAALEEAAKGSDANAKAAKKALAALGEGESEEEPTEPAAPASDTPAAPPAAAAAASAQPVAPAAAAPAAAPATVSAQTAVQLAAVGGDLAARVATLEAKHEAEQRVQLLASRPDLSEGMRKLLADKPLADVKAMLAEIPVRTPAPAAAATVTGTRGAGQGAGETARLDPMAKAELDAKMGLTGTTVGVRDDGHKLVLGAVLPPSNTPTPTTTPTPPAPPAAR